MGSNGGEQDRKKKTKFNNGIGAGLFISYIGLIIGLTLINAYRSLWVGYLVTFTTLSLSILFVYLMFKIPVRDQ